MSGSPYDYDQIPIGFYDQVLRSGNPVRRLWHLSKFERVLDSLPRQGKASLLDIGCFAGSFLSLIPETQFARQLGVDILSAQVSYAQKHYGTNFREFRHIPDIDALDNIHETFDCVTLIEVIEHLTREQVASLMGKISRKLNPGGKLIVTTPNYASTWPVLELLLNRMSQVKYEEQHITRFTYFNMERRLADLYPAFSDEFSVQIKTTSHLLTPFLAALSFKGARALSRAIPHQAWRQPFGNLVLLVAERTSIASTAARNSAVSR